MALRLGRPANTRREGSICAPGRGQAGNLGREGIAASKRRLGDRTMVVSPNESQVSGRQLEYLVMGRCVQWYTVGVMRRTLRTLRKHFPMGCILPAHDK